MKQKAYTLGEEIFSSVTHGVGTLLSVGGTVVLIVAAAMFGDALTVVSVTVFGASMIILYCMSTLYHAITHPKAKRFFRVMDHNTLEKFRKPSVVCYIAMGWVIVIAIRPLLEKMDALCLWLLVAGGVFYTVGVIFYAIKKVRYFHSVWHIFVLMGSLCHYLSILFAILP